MSLYGFEEAVVSRFKKTWQVRPEIAQGFAAKMQERAEEKNMAESIAGQLGWIVGAAIGLYIAFKWALPLAREMRAEGAAREAREAKEKKAAQK